MASLSLTNHFLIAMPTMEDPYFAKSLVFVAEHNDEGALGVIVNRPIDMSLATLVRKIDVPLDAAILYPIARTAASSNATEAAAFIGYVRSPAGQAILARYGFLKP